MGLSDTSLHGGKLYYNHSEGKHYAASSHDEAEQVGFVAKAEQGSALCHGNHELSRLSHNALYA